MLSYRERTAKVLKVGDSFTTSRTFTKAEIGGIVPGDEERRVICAMLSEGDPTNGPPDRVGSKPGE